MTKDEALKLALEALEPLVRRAAPWGEMDWLNGCKAITAIKEALAQPERTPYITMPPSTPMWTIPPQRTWVGLTDEEIQTEWVLTPQNDKAEGIWFGRRIEAKLKEKNT